MSASRDKGQRFTFVYSNLYEIYKKGKEAAKSAEGSVGGHQILQTGIGNPNSSQFAMRVHPYRPIEFMQKRVEDLEAKQPLRTVSAAANEQSTQAVHGLRQNLQTLKDLHERLDFMLKELQDLVKK